MTETEQLADVIALSVHAATQPLLIMIKALEARPVTQVSQDAWNALQDTLSDLRTRLAAAEARAPIPGPAGPQGERGDIGPKGADGLHGKDGAPGLNGKDGRDGLDGKDGAIGVAGKDGRDGLDGKDGAIGVAGKDGRDGIDGKDGAPGLHGKDGATGLQGDKGTNGRDGLPGVPGRWGDKGEPGTNGKDGRDGLNGKDGADGLNGKDGLGFEDIDVAFDEQRGWALCFVRGDQSKTFPIPIPFDAGVWTAGRIYPKGAGTTVNGAFWLAREATKTRPGDGSPESSKAWRLAVKGGKDGKPGPQGPAGKDGES